ncbi:MAG: hypothetical protein NTV69_15910 [Caldilinea sp.]|nr:hypothetical protein [Caldilinea sp.]
MLHRQRQRHPGTVDRCQYHIDQAGQFIGNRVIAEFGGGDELAQKQPIAEL